ncbi:ABC transporter permease [bacterium]|nr:ABC transporter permease [bacterium]
MDSQGLSGQLKLPNRFLPLWAVIVDDLKQGVRHWAFIWWLALSSLLAVVWFIETPTTPAPTPIASTSGSFTAHHHSSFAEAASLGAPRASLMAAKAIRLHLFLWATLVIALAGSSIAGESETVGESILCRGISRWQYYLGKVFSRVTLTVVSFIILTLSAVLLSLAKCHNDLSFWGLFEALFKGSLFLGAVAAISVAGSSWFRNSLLAVAVAWMVVYGFGIVVSLLQIDRYSPVRFIEWIISQPKGSSPLLTATGLLTILGYGALVANIISLIGFSRRDY